MTNKKRTLGICGGAPLADVALSPIRPCFPDLASFIKPFSTALEAGAVTNNGRAVQEFEAALEAFFGAGVAVFNNGQTAMMAMLRAAGIRGGEIIVPSYTFAGTPHAVTWCGATPVFCDLDDRRTLTLGAESVEKCISDNTVAILAVDIHGLSCDYAAFEDIGRRHGIPVFFDSAQAFGTRVDGKVVGASGSAQMFSFHATKSFSTMEGGCVVSRDSALLERMKAIRNFGQNAGTQCDEAGLNGKMLEVCALIGLEQLKSFDAVAHRRIEIGDFFADRLADVGGIYFPEVPANQTPAWFNFPIIVEEPEFGLDRDELASALLAENIEVRKYFDQPCHRMNCYGGNGAATLPNAEAVSARVVSLPIYNDMTIAECETIVQAIREIGESASLVRAALAG